MSACPDLQKIAAHLDGEEVEHGGLPFEQHLQTCRDCQRENLQLSRASAGLSSIPLPQPAGAISVHVVERIEQQKHRRLWLLGAAVSAVCAVATVAVILPSPDEGFIARKATATQDQGLRVFSATHEGEPAVELGVDAPRDNMFSFSVFRSRNAASYSMIFAVDAANEVHWFYPSHTDDAESPKAVALKHQGWSLLPDAVRMDAPAVGDIQFVLFTATEQFDVHQIESLLRDSNGLEALRAKGHVSVVRSKLR